MSDRLDSLAATWTVLGRLIADPPSDETLDALRTIGLRQEWPLSPTARTREGLALLAASAASGEVGAAVADDHFHLFRGPGSGVAPPWESVHVSVDRLLFDDETFGVRDAFARHGLQAPNLNREPDDHIALELEFCATLLTRAMDALEAGDVATYDELVAAHDAFCREHLLAFAPEFFRLVEAGARTEFYRGVGILGADAVAQVSLELT